MDFSYPAHVQELVGKIRQFIDTEVIPLEKHDHDHPDGLPPDMLQDLRQKAKAAGIWAPQLSPKWGGLGLTLEEIVPVFETAGRSLLGPAAININAPDEGNMHLLHLAGTDDQKAQYLRPLADGDIRSAFAMTEPAPGAGADPNMLKTRAVKDGDDWVINGHKWFATGADGAAFLIIMALTDPDKGPRDGATMFLAPIETDGINIVRRIPIMGAESPGGHCEIIFDNLRLPHSAILGEQGKGYALAQQRLGPARLTHCMRWTGIAQRGMEIATHYAAKREAFGQQLVAHQSIQWMLADSATEIHAGRLMIQYAAYLLAQGERASTETSMAKIHVAETVGRVLDRAIQICGGMGISKDLPLGTWFAEARAFRIYDGPSEVHRMVIARRIIRNFGSHA